MSDWPYPFQMTNQINIWTAFGASWPNLERTDDNLGKLSKDYSGNVGTLTQDVLFGRYKNEVRADARFEILSGFYTVRDPINVRHFLMRRPALVTLLFEALPKVKEAWGRDAKTELELLEDPEDDSSSLVVRVESNDPDPYTALDRFDEQWWLAKAGSSDGLLNFAVQSK